MRRRLALTLALAALLSACQEAPEPTATVAPPIIEGQNLRYPPDHPQLALLTTQTVEAARQLPIELPARIVWNETRTQRLFAPMSGRVTQLRADVGQSVRAGQVLVELASPDYGAAQADAARANADLQLARKTLQRQQELFDAGVLARKDLEQAEAEMARAQAEAARAQARQRLYGSGDGVNQALGLRSEMDGVVVERNLNPGQELRSDSAGPPLLVVSDPRSLWVMIDAQEADLPTLRPGVAVELVVPSLGNQRFAASVQAVTDQIDPNTRTIKIRARVDNPQRLLKNEMLAQVRYARPTQGLLEVPATAVFLNGSQHHVFVQTGPSSFATRDVRIAHEGAQRVLVAQGLQAGDKVVSQNGLMLARELRLAQEAAHAKGAARP